MGHPLTLYGPVMSSSPVPSCFSTTTRLPLCASARMMATAPGASAARSFLACLEKKFLEGPLTLAATVGTSFARRFTRTILVPPFFSPPICFSTNWGVFAVVLQHKSLDILNSLAEGQPLVGRLSPQLLHHLPLLLNPSRHPDFLVKL